MKIKVERFPSHGQIVETHGMPQFGDIVKVADDAYLTPPEEPNDMRWMVLSIEGTEVVGQPYVMLSLGAGGFVSHWSSLDGFTLVERLGE